jgi:hypothetical protein
MPAASLSSSRQRQTISARRKHPWLAVDELVA